MPCSGGSVLPPSPRGALASRAVLREEEKNLADDATEVLVDATKGRATDVVVVKGRAKVVDDAAKGKRLKLVRRAMLYYSVCVCVLG